MISKEEAFLLKLKTTDDEVSKLFVEMVMRDSFETSMTDIDINIYEKTGYLPWEYGQESLIGFNIVWTEQDKQNIISSIEKLQDDQAN